MAYPIYEWFITYFSMATMVTMVNGYHGYNGSTRFVLGDVPLNSFADAAARCALDGQAAFAHAHAVIIKKACEQCVFNRWQVKDNRKSPINQYIYIHIILYYIYIAYPLSYPTNIPYSISHYNFWVKLVFFGRLPILGIRCRPRTTSGSESRSWVAELPGLRGFMVMK